MPSFSLFSTDLCLVILTYIDILSLQHLASVEKYLAILLGNITTWQYLHQHRLPHRDIISTSIRDIRDEIWLSQHYYLTITNVDKKNLVVITSNRDVNKGCLLAYHHFKMGCPFTIDYKISSRLLQPGLVEMTSTDITTMIKPHSYLQSHSINIVDAQSRKVLMSQHTVDKVIYDPYRWSHNWWFRKPSFLVDINDDIRRHVILTLQHLGLTGIQCMRIVDDHV